MKRYHTETEHFSWTSWGGGLSYALRHKASGLEVFVQGDDASRLENELISVQEHKPQLTLDECYAWLWDQCDYGSLATR